MKPLEEYLSEQSEVTIQTLASYIQQCIEEQWQQVLQQDLEELLRIYDKAGEGAAYGTYAHRLFQPVQEQLKRAGFRSSPGFPGTLSTSREWGPPHERERWMWCVVGHEQAAPLGTLVIRLVHDHTQFRLPHPPGVMVVTQLGKLCNKELSTFSHWAALSLSLISRNCTKENRQWLPNSSQRRSPLKARDLSC